MPPVAQQAPAPNSPQAKQQVNDGMDELRKLLESTARNSGAEAVAKPAAVDERVEFRRQTGHGRQ